MSNIQFVLYSTFNCHLCEDAEHLLKQTNIKWQAIEIVDNDELLKLYEIRIPVLHNCLTKAELCWPFNLTDVVNFSKL